MKFSFNFETDFDTECIKSIFYDTENSQCN